MEASPIESEDFTTINSYEFHRPNELLAYAKELLEKDEIWSYRPAILEAITCLEVTLTEIVMSKLRLTVHPLILDFLEKKTKMSFDSRVNILTPAALNQSSKLQDCQKSLWENYITAKKIRNKITHGGYKATKSDASFVINCVEEWLSFLGYTIDYDISVLKLKHKIEKEGLMVIDRGINIYSDIEETLNGVFDKFYNKENPTPTYKLNSENSISAPDYLIEFGSKKVMYEYKFLRTPNYKILCKDYNDEACKKYGVDRLVIIIFWLEDNTESMPNNLEIIEKFNGNEMVDIIGIRTKLIKVPF